MSPIDRPIYKYWQALYLSFYSKRFYIDVFKRWRGFGLVYFALVVSLAVIPFSIKTIREFVDYYDNQLMEPLKQMPQFQVSKGKLVFDYFMPYLIKNKNQDVVIVIDNTSQLTEINYIYPYWMLLVTADHIYFRPPAFSKISALLPQLAKGTEGIVAEDFADMDYEVFDATLFLKTTHLLTQKWYLASMIYPLFASMIFGFFTALIFFLTLLGQVLSHTVFRFKLPFKVAFRMMTVSSSCAIALFILVLTSGEKFPFMGLALMTCISFYFSFGVLAARKESKQLVRT